MKQYRSKRILAMKTASFAVASILLVAQSGSGWAAATVASSATGVTADVRGRASSLVVGSSVEAGVSLLVGRGRGETVLTFDGGCRVTLQPGQTYVIPEVAPCVPPAAPAEAAAGGLGGIPVAVVGGVVVAGGVAGVVAATSKSGSSAVPYLSP